MSNSNLDSVETTLRDLKDILDRNHPDSHETSMLMKDMERLVAEMKSKASPDLALISTTIIDSVPVTAQTVILV